MFIPGLASRPIAPFCYHHNIATKCSRCLSRFVPPAHDRWHRSHSLSRHVCLRLIYAWGALPDMDRRWGYCLRLLPILNCY